MIFNNYELIINIRGYNRALLFFNNSSNPLTLMANPINSIYPQFNESNLNINSMADQDNSIRNSNIADSYIIEIRSGEDDEKDDNQDRNNQITINNRAMNGGMNEDKISDSSQSDNNTNNLDNNSDNQSITNTPNTHNHVYANVAIVNNLLNNMLNIVNDSEYEENKGRDENKNDEKNEYNSVGNIQLITDEEIIFAQLELSLWSNVRDTNYTTIRNIVNIWRRNSDGKFPSVDQLVDHFNNDSCYYLLQYSPELRKQIIKYSLIELGRMPTYIEVQAIIEWYNFHDHNMPTFEDLSLTIDRLMQLSSSAETFHQQDKVLVGIKNKSLLVSQIITAEESKTAQCAICQDDLIEGQQYYKLPCLHCFHTNASECLGESSIDNWLSKSKYCPVCRTELTI